MKRSLFTLIILLIACSASISAQENKTSRFEISASYGVGYNPFTQHYHNGDVNNSLELNIPKIGSFAEFNLDYRLSGNRFIGLGYARQVNSGKINDQMSIISSPDINIVLDNYKHTITKHLIDFHFRMNFHKNMHLTVGLFYFFDRQNTYDNYQNWDDNFNFLGGDIVFYNEKDNRADNFGFFASYEYYYPITNYLDIGIKAKIYLSLNEIESAALLPTLKVRF